MPDEALVTLPNVNILSAPDKDYDDVYDRFREAQNAKSQFEAQCQAMYRLYASYANRKNYKYFNNIDIPIPFKLIETMTPFLCSNVPNPNCTPQDEDSVMPAMRMDAVMKHYIRRPENMIEMTHWYKSMLVYSLGVVKDGWDFKRGLKRRWAKDVSEIISLASLIPDTSTAANEVNPQSMVDGTASRAVNFIMEYAKAGKMPGVKYDPAFNWFIFYDLDVHDQPTYKTIHPLDFFWLGQGDSEQHMDSLFHRYFFTRKAVEDIQSSGDKRYKNIDIVLKDGSLSTSTVDDLQEKIGILSPKPSVYEFIEEHRIDKNGMVRVKTICRTAQAVVFNEEMPYFHNKMPFSVIRMYPRQGEFVGTPMLKVVESLCAATNQMGNQILDNGLLAINGVFIRRKGTKGKEKQYNLFGGAIIEGRPDDFKILDIKDVRQSSLEMMKMYMGFISSITGVNDILDQPMPGSPGTSAGIEQLNFSNTARLKTQHFMDTQAINGLMERIASNIRQYVRQTKRIRVEIGDGSFHYISVSPQDMVGDYSFHVDVKQMQSSNSAVARAQLQTLLNLSVGLMRAWKDPATGQVSARLIANVEALYKSILGTYDCIDRPDMYVIDPSDVRAIPPMQIPPPAPPTTPLQPNQTQISQGQEPLTPAKFAARMPTASGTKGIPPQMGGPQQSGLNSSASMPNPATAADAIQSARSLQ